MQLIATNVSPVRSASARGHRLRVQAPAAPHLRLTRKQTFSEHFRALRIAPGSGCRLGAIHPTSENRNSAKFALTAFSEVRLIPVQHRRRPILSNGGC